MNRIVSNTIQLKKVNLERIRQVIKLHPFCTKADVARETGLSHATCNNLLNQMLVMGEIEVANHALPSGGRPATQFLYNKDYQQAICMYVSNEGQESVLAYVVVNAVGEVLEEVRAQADAISSVYIEGVLDNLLKRYFGVQAIGIGVPGEVQDGYIDRCDVKTLENVNLKQPLQDKYNVEVVVENDMDYITYGYHLGNQEEHGSENQRNLAVIYFSKDHLPGCGLVVDDRLLKGSTMFAGELSYISTAYGMSRNEQILRLNDPVGFPELAAKSIIAVVALINPQAVILLGDILKSVDIEELQRRCAQVVPQKHLPRLCVSDQIHTYYIKGLVRTTLNTLSYNIPILQRGI